MWNKLDKLDEQFYKDYTIMDLYDEIIDEYNRSEINTKIANKSDINRFKRLIEKNCDSLNKVGKIKAKSFLNRTKIANNEILEFILYIIYNKKQNELDKYENLMAKELCQDVYDKEVQEIANKTNKPIPKRKSTFFDNLLILIFANINARGYIWKNYVDGTVSYNANETYRYLSVNGTKGLKDLLEKQKRRIINKKKEPSEDKFSGSLDEQLIMLANKTKIKAYEDMGIKQVRFIAINDKKTTEMCESLDNQLFYINKKNVYQRYSDLDKRIVTYTTIGLNVGDNLPPINNNFHWCRSTITYLTELESDGYKALTNLSQDEENAIKNYVSSYSYKINPKLREDKLNKEEQEYVNELDNALVKMPKYKGEVKRSIPINSQKELNEILEPFNNKDKIGSWKDYTSARANGVYDDSFELQMNILSKSGRNISAFNPDYGDEILFLRNTKFKLLSVKKLNGKIYANLKEV